MEKWMYECMYVLYEPRNDLLKRMGPQALSPEGGVSVTPGSRFRLRFSLRG